MSKRYQVFLSSTYADLKEERQKVIQTLMEMDCIPAGMEIFPAVDEEQFEFIKRVIDDCDYYLLIIGGRYGSTTEEGISYTEKEYDYALEKGLKIIVLLHEHPEKITVEKSDIEPVLREKLQEFRVKVSNSRLIKFWNNAEELPGLVSLSLAKTIKTYPAIGWVRANTVANEDILNEINDVRKENNILRSKIAEISEKTYINIENIAGLDEKFTVHGTYTNLMTKSDYGWSSTLTWREIFAYIAPYLMKFPSDTTVKNQLTDDLAKKENLNTYMKKINDQDFQTITLQLKTLGLINTRYTKTTTGTMAVFWSLTSQGEKLMIESRTVKSKKKTK